MTNEQRRIVDTIRRYKHILDKQENEAKKTQALIDDAIERLEESKAKGVKS